MLTLGLSALFQRLRSQCGGHRQQDRAGDGELPPFPRTFPPRVLCPGWDVRCRVGALPRAGVPQPAGSPLPIALPGTAALCLRPLELIGSRHCAVRREPGWTCTGTSGSGAARAGFPGCSGTPAPQIPGQGRGLESVSGCGEVGEMWLRELQWMSTKPWLGFQGWGGEG